MIESLFVEIFGLEFTEANIAKIIAGGIFALLGLALNYLIKVSKVIDKENKFSLYHFINANWKDILVTLILMFVFMRFSQELIGVEPTMFIALGIGYGVENLKEIFIGKMKNYEQD